MSVYKKIPELLLMEKEERFKVLSKSIDSRRKVKLLVEFGEYLNEIVDQANDLRKKRLQKALEVMSQ